MIKDGQFELVNSEIWCICPVVVIALSYMKQELPFREVFFLNSCTGWAKMQDYADIKYVSIYWIGVKLQLENIYNILHIKYNCVAFDFLAVTFVLHSRFLQSKTQ